MKIYHTRIWGEISFYQAILSEEKILLESFEHYQKRSSRNRYKILSSNGLISLSIPLQKGKNNKKPIKDVKISYDENWVSKHLNAIKSAYASSPYFHYVYPEISEIYNKKPTYLFDLNLESIDFILNFIQSDVKIELTTEFRGEKSNEVTSFDINPYPQVFEYKNGFQPIDSMLDLVFCAGPESILYL